MRAITWAGILAARANEPSACTVTVSQQNRSFLQLSRDELVFGKPFGEVQVSDALPISGKDEAKIAEQPTAHSRPSAPRL